MAKRDNNTKEYQNNLSPDLPRGDKYVPQKGSVSYADVILDGQPNQGYASKVRPGNKLNRQGK